MAYEVLQLSDHGNDLATAIAAASPPTRIEVGAGSFAQGSLASIAPAGDIEVVGKGAYNSLLTWAGAGTGYALAIPDGSTRVQFRDIGLGGPSSGACIYANGTSSGVTDGRIERVRMWGWETGITGQKAWRWTIQELYMTNLTRGLDLGVNWNGLKATGLNIGLCSAEAVRMTGASRGMLFSGTAIEAVDKAFDIDDGSSIVISGFYIEDVDDTLIEFNGNGILIEGCYLNGYSAGNTSGTCLYGVVAQGNGWAMRGCHLRNMPVALRRHSSSTQCSWANNYWEDANITTRVEAWS